MPSAFENLGLQHIGRERQYMSGGPLGDLAKMIPAGLLGYGLYKSGAVDNLNDMFNPQKIIANKIAGAVAPEKGYAIGDPSETGFNPAKDKLNNMYGIVPNQASGVISPYKAEPTNQVDEHKKTLDEMFPNISSAPSVTPDVLQMRDPSQDSGIMTAQAVAPPPSPVGQTQMGKDTQGGGVSMGDIAKLLMAFA